MSNSVRGFNVTHQKVFVDIDPKEQTLRGWTELTVAPSTKHLKHIILDARRMTIEKCIVGGIEAQFIHKDLLSSCANIPKSWNVHQSSWYKKKLESLINSDGSTGPGELVIQLPSELSIEEEKESSDEYSHGNREITYENLIVNIHYHLNGTRNEGLNFVNSDPREAHVYTTHQPIAQATSCWLPCVDGLWSFSTWELEFSVSQYLDNDDIESEIIVVCSDASPQVEPDQRNNLRKLVKFSILNPVCSQHIGFAIGPFKAISLVAPEEGEETARNVSSTIPSLGNYTSTSGSQVSNESQTLPINAYVLPSKLELVWFCCQPLVLAMMYFTRDFGSFPYDSYSVVFVSNFPYNTKITADACALTIFNDNLLYNANLIEPRIYDCHFFIRGIAAQWSGVSIVPASWQDLWVTEGIAMFLTNLFIKKFMGNNEYRFRICRANEQLCQEDINQPPIGLPKFRFPLFQDDLEFLRLKAPLVLFILDCRMTKTDRSLGISRVLTKLFLQCMSGDLKSQLSTHHFVRQCEKVAHHRLTKFFDEWVFGSGFPIFRITQRFNKKRLCIEMVIGQVHSGELPQEVLKDSSLLRKAIIHLDVINERNEAEAENLQLMKAMLGENGETEMPDFVPVSNFSGPMTIRIHEANGTPYEHVVELRDQFTKIDIPYNTKYKRLRRSQKFRKETGKDFGTLENDRLINCLGDVLMSEKEMADWILVDWGDMGDEEEIMFNEAFEWLRADADFEWLGQFFVSQPDYMYASQLQQDQDVVAQYDAVMFFGRQQPNHLYTTVLTRTLMDQRYFYGIRVAAAHQMVNFSVPQLNFAGMHLLLRVFRELYCFKNSRLPKANNFEDVAGYLVQKEIPLALSKVRNPTTGMCPTEICQFILDLLRYNENSENSYSDCYYMANLLICATNTLRHVDPISHRFVAGGNSSRSIWEDEKSRKYLNDVVVEIEKCQRLDRWIPSHQLIVTTTAIKMEELLVLNGYGEPRIDKLLLACQPGESTEVRCAAISSLLNLNGYSNKEVTQHLLQIFLEDPEANVRCSVINALKLLIGHVAINGELSAIDKNSGLRYRRQQHMARHHVNTVIPLLRSTLGKSHNLQDLIWQCMTSPLAGSLEKRVLLEICEVLYEPEGRLVAIMKCPPLYKISMRRHRDFVMVAKYRSVLKKQKIRQKEPPKIKLKLR